MADKSKDQDWKPLPGANGSPEGSTGAGMYGLGGRGNLAQGGKKR